MERKQGRREREKTPTFGVCGPLGRETIAPTTRSKASEGRREGRERSPDIQPDHNDEPANAQRTPAENRVFPADLGTTLAGRPRRRMKWTTEMNEYIMRCYYIITRNEVDVGAYRPRLHQVFLERYPDLPVTEQRIADQKRTILHRNLIPQVRLAQIRQEVARDLQINPDENNEADVEQEVEREPIQLEEPIIAHLDPVVLPRDHIEEQTEERVSLKLKQEFRRAILEFTDTDPLLRPSIPRQNSSRKLSNATAIMNTMILPQYLDENIEQFDELQTALYSAAVAVVRTTGGKISNRKDNIFTQRNKPAWEYRLTYEIEELRRQMGRLTQYISGNRTPKIVAFYQQLQKRLAMHTQQDPPNNTANLMLDTLRQKLSVKASRLRRYRQSAKRKAHNSLFIRNEKEFYRQMRKGVSITEPPLLEDVENFWRGIWANEGKHVEDAGWITSEEERVSELPVMENVEFLVEDVTSAVNKVQNWKATGPDGIHNFWIKRFSCVHAHLARLFTCFSRNPQSVPTYLTKGKTYLLPKDESNTHDPSKYRPITCLCNLYKILTACIAEKIYVHLEQNSVFALEQKGCIRRSQGCKEQLTIDAVVMEQAYHKSRNIFTAFIDYSKAFDSVPHSWLVRVLEIYKVAPNIIAMLKHVMSLWETVLHLYYNTGSLQSQPIPIKRGIFQGDSLSPIWFCLALNPLSALLNKTGYGFLLKGSEKTQYRLTHLLYMDDIKLYGATEKQIINLLQTTKQFSDDIKMSFGLDKCRKMSIQGRHVTQRDLELENGCLIEALHLNESYKYLGLHQTTRIQHKNARLRVRDLYLNRVTSILKTSLNGKNLIKAINTYAIPVLTYTFGVIKWSETDLQALERDTRRLLTKFRVHHPRSAVERLTLPRHEGGRGLINISRLHKIQICGLRNYFTKQNNELHQAIRKSDNKYTPLDLLHDYNEPQTNSEYIQHQKQVWKSKPLHGAYANILDQPHIDKNASCGWLGRAYLFSETEGFIIAIQDQVIATKNYLKYIAKTNKEDDLCRRCRQQPETIQHITGACHMLAATEYLARHNRAAKIVHQSLAQRHGLITDQSPYYQYIPTAVLENESYKLYWDRSVLTDRTIVCNRPDIILIDKSVGETYLIDIGIPNNHNIQKYYAEKQIKYQQLSEEIKRLWHQEHVTVVPLIISATGVIPKTLLTNLKRLGVEEKLIAIQKSVILSTSSIVRSFLNSSTQMQ